MLKKEILRASAYNYDVTEHKQQIREMDDQALVSHRKALMFNNKAGKISADEYWSRMLTINAEMAARFCRRVGR